ncbi:MAG: FAD-linked oxidase C-terminal domain-containing protein [Trueperaceae bacterium]
MVFPESSEQVLQVVRFAAENRLAVTPVGANSSLEGQTVPVRGGISLDLSRMSRIVEFRAQDLMITVQAGVTYPKINEHVRRSGLFFPVDPGAHASLGGMVGTNASGTGAVRYGVTRDYVLMLEVVLPSGEIVRVGNKARKSSSGYDLRSLFCGAEGTLGVVTEVTLRLVGLPESASAARVAFGDAGTATEYVVSLIQAGAPVARCELIDSRSVAAINAHLGSSFPEQMTVFLEFHGSPAGVAESVELAQHLAFDAGALDFQASADPGERERLWAARHSHFVATVAANPGLRNIVTDVAVPISALPDAVGHALAASEQVGLAAYLVGHVGDGNFHLALFYPGDDLAARNARDVAHSIVEHALSVGGTSTGEHGVGLRKLPYMEAEHGSALELMRGIKQLFDPQGIMNPGKKIPEVNRDPSLGAKRVESPSN